MTTLWIGFVVATIVLSELLRPRPQIEQGTGPPEKVKTGLWSTTMIGTERYDGEQLDLSNPYRAPRCE